MIWVVLVGVLAIGAVVGVVAANGRTRHVVRAERTSALKGSAANGGRVIVVLKQTNRNVSLAHGLARRRAVDSAQQAPIVSNIKRSGGSKLHALTLVNAVAADVSSKEAHALANLSNVAEVVPDQQVTETVPLTAQATNVAPGAGQCPTNPSKPLVEPEALQTMHYEGTGSQEADKIADGSGVIVAIDGMNELAGNPNFTRADGSHVVD